MVERSLGQPERALDFTLTSVVPFRIPRATEHVTCLFSNVITLAMSGISTHSLRASIMISLLPWLFGSATSFLFATLSCGLAVTMEKCSRTAALWLFAWRGGSDRSSLHLTVNGRMEVPSLCLPRSSACLRQLWTNLALSVAIGRMPFVLQCFASTELVNYRLPTLRRAFQLIFRA